MNRRVTVCITKDRGCSVGEGRQDKAELQ